MIGLLNRFDKRPVSSLGGCCVAGFHTGMFGEKLAECLIDQFADGDISAEAGGFGCRQHFELVVIAGHHPSPELCARRFGGGAGACRV